MFPLSEITRNTDYVHKQRILTLAQTISPWHHAHSPRHALQINNWSFSAESNT